MIISHKHKFIFLKTKKTAGTSIEILLSKYCGEDDIITPISSEDEVLREKLGYCTAQNYSYRRDGKDIKFHNHISADRVKEYIGDSIWNEYYKFCFERNPFEKVVSFYFWEHKNEPRPAISEFIHSDRLKRLFYGDGRNYLIDSKIAVDKVYLYEELNEAFSNILNRLNIVDESFVLPRAKSKYRKDRRAYSQILSSDDIEYIGSLFKDEINKFY